MLNYKKEIHQAENMSALFILRKQKQYNRGDLIYTNNKNKTRIKMFL